MDRREAYLQIEADNSFTLQNSLIKSLIFSRQLLSYLSEKASTVYIIVKVRLCHIFKNLLQKFAR